MAGSHRLIQMPFTLRFTLLQLLKCLYLQILRTFCFAINGVMTTNIAVHTAESRAVDVR